jgi:DNA processing protein
MDDVRDWVELSLVPGIGSKTFHRLLDYFRTPGEALRASRSELKQVPGLSATSLDALRHGCKPERDKAFALIEQHGVNIITCNDSSYPERLKHIHDPPPLLYVKKTLCASDRNSISIVGSRRATRYGKTVAERLAGDLARMGITVVSGLAYGVDAAAHKGALAAGGRTIAVLGCGVDVVYPRANARLYEQIVTSGALISEFPMGSQPDAAFFPVRNRIVSGLSLGTLVVEAPRRSGALITANHALEQGREVFAVPGDIYSPYCEGCHKLIKDGAKLVENVYDIIGELEGVLEEIAPDAPAEKTPPDGPAVSMSPEEKKVFNFLSMVPEHIDDIAEECALNAAGVASALMTLEIKGLVEQVPGKRFIRRT